MNHLWLGLSILFEVMATTALKASDGMRHWRPAVLVVLGYGIAFCLLSLALRTIPVGVAYAIWSGAGIVLVSAIGYFLFRQSLALSQWLGIGLIAAGVIVLQAGSQPIA
ncbi:MAG: DMT family transporter [Rhodoferax sp.]